MEASKAASTPRLDLSHVYGLRLFHERRMRLTLAGVAAVIAVLHYLREAIGELAIIHHRPLEFDFGQFYRAAQDLSAGRNPSDSFVHPHFHTCALSCYI